MIISALVHDRFHHVEHWDDINRVIDEAIDRSLPGSADAPLPAGEVAQFYCATQPWTDEVLEWAPDNFLQLASNPSAGYAALTWGGFLGEATMETFVSFSTDAPLSTPPRLVIDPGYPHDHDPRSALPLEQARTALREFCRTGGARPASVTWVRGDFTGAILQPLPDVVA
ncbi:Imm1 family immunity protein [Actinopolyspora halophila]|uniref:Imm1 family immunity protein n=1 Tax=Actinopolyspora halophila TaxID=1850 RepID=UPI00036DC9B7|nr:Imm1 family immunity protein [Actinopolyspora halophila]